MDVPFQYDNRLLLAATGVSFSISDDDGESFVSLNSANGMCVGPYMRIYASGQTILVSGGGGLSISTDRGRTFRCKSNSNGSGLSFDSGQGVFFSGNMIFFGSATGVGLNRSVDSGVSWALSTTANGLGSNIVRGITMLGSTLYLATDTSLSKSLDNGSTYTSVISATVGLGSSTIQAVANNGTQIFVATGTGVSTSADGATFTTYSSGLLSTIVNDVYAKGSLVLASTPGGLSITSSIASGFSTKTMAANGLPSDTINGATATPEGTVIFAATPVGIGKSVDSGATFVSRTTTHGLGENMTNAVFYLVP